MTHFATSDGGSEYIFVWHIPSGNLLAVQKKRQESHLMQKRSGGSGPHQVAVLLAADAGGADLPGELPAVARWQVASLGGYPPWTEALSGGWAIEANGPYHFTFYVDPNFRQDLAHPDRMASDGVLPDKNQAAGDSQSLADISCQ